MAPHLPAGSTLRVMEMRNFARAKQELARAAADPEAGKALKRNAQHMLVMRVAKARKGR